jgi:hypothetical protein
VAAAKEVLFPCKVKVLEMIRLNPQLADMACIGSLFASYEEEVGFMGGDNQGEFCR